MGRGHSPGGRRAVEAGGPVRRVGSLSGRILAIDPGEARIGLARSDSLGVTAQPLETVPVRRDGSHLDTIRAIVEQDEIERVVIGLPLLMSGDEGDAARSARELAGVLEAALGDCDVVLWDERLTTVQAERAMIDGNVRRARRKKRIDAVAAVLILQSYLDAGAPVT